MGERCPTEQLQIWSTTTPDTSLFILGDQLPEATGYSTGLSGLMKCKYSFICFLTLLWVCSCSSINKENTAIQQLLLPLLHAVRKVRLHFDVTMTQHGCCGDVWEFLVGLLWQLMPLPFILHLVWQGEACIVGRHLQVKILVRLRKKNGAFFSTGILSFCSRWPSWVSSLNFCPLS